MAESRKEFKDRLIREGRWRAFLEKREFLVSTGWSRSDAWGEARLSYDEAFSDEEIAELAKTVEECPASEMVTIVSDPQEVTAEVSTTSAPKAPLKVQAQLEDFEGKPKATIRENAEWVAEHLCVEGVVPEDAPSMAAWSMWETFRVSASSRLEFYKTVYARLMPSKAQVDAQDRYSDDGRSTEELLEAFKRSLTDDEPESTVCTPGAEGPSEEH